MMGDEDQYTQYLTLLVFSSPYPFTEKNKKANVLHFTEVR